MNEADDRQTGEVRKACSIDWYAEGESRTVIVGDVEVTVRFIGRKGRRGRICITAPAGARFVEA